MTKSDYTTNIGFLFDLDGVLIDSERQYTRIWEEIDKAVPTGVEGFALKIKGTTLTNILATYFPGEETKERVRNMLDDLEKKMVYEYTSGAKEFLTSLQHRGYEAVMVTSSNQDKMEILWSQHPEMRHLFHEVVTGDKVSHSKPHPEGYLLGASLLNAHPKRCVVFEDSLQGVKAGRDAGCYVIGIAGTIDKNMLLEYADVVVDSLQEIELDRLVNLLISRK